MNNTPTVLFLLIIVLRWHTGAYTHHLQRTSKIGQEVIFEKLWKTVKITNFAHTTHPPNVWFWSLYFYRIVPKNVSRISKKVQEGATFIHFFFFWGFIWLEIESYNKWYEILAYERYWKPPLKENAYIVSAMIFYSTRKTQIKSSPLTYLYEHAVDTWLPNIIPTNLPFFDLTFFIDLFWCRYLSDQIPKCYLFCEHFARNFVPIIYALFVAIFVTGLPNLVVSRDYQITQSRDTWFMPQVPTQAHGVTLGTRHVTI